MVAAPLGASMDARPLAATAVTGHLLTIVYAWSQLPESLPAPMRTVFSASSLSPLAGMLPPSPPLVAVPPVCACVCARVYVACVCAWVRGCVGARARACVCGGGGDAKIHFSFCHQQQR